eukprot:1045782-Pleurochrysis_carterae.AAC.1
MEWAAGLLAHNLLLRAGELGQPCERAFDHTKDLTWASVKWMQLTAASDGHKWALIYIVPIKDVAARHQATPTPLRRRRKGGALGEDP